MHDLVRELLSYLKATWHYRWLAVLVAWVIALGGWASVHRMPDRYEASTRVWVDTQSVVKNLLAGLTAQPNVNQMVGMISRTLVSRPNLEKVVRMADMDIGLQGPVDREQLVTRLSREVAFKSAGAENLFTIAYTDKDPQKALMVVQSLLTIFEEQSVSDQRKDSEAAQHFINEEIKTAREKLAVAEDAMIAFRRGRLLASGRGDVAAQMISAEATLNEARLELKVAETRLEGVKKSVADAVEVPSLLDDTKYDVEANPESDPRIVALEQKLDALRLDYTDQHPDVVALVRTIAQLKEQKKAEAKPRKPSPSSARTPDPVPQQVTLAVAAAEANVATMRARVEEYSKRYDELRAAAIVAPQVDAEYSQVARDYEMAKSTYGALLARRETARISSEMESKTRATDFRVIDPPQVSSRPKAPNRRLLNTVVLLMALGGGFAAAFLVSQIRPTFNDERRLREVSGLEVLGTVVMAWTDEQKWRRTRGLVAFFLSFLTLLSAYVAVLASFMVTVSRV
jgi:polysaccharide chain length determinant protein (PEP-CTERM system associated)